MQSQELDVLLLGLLDVSDGKRMLRFCVGLCELNPADLPGRLLAVGPWCRGVDARESHGWSPMRVRSKGLAASNQDGLQG